MNSKKYFYRILFNWILWRRKIIPEQRLNAFKTPKHRQGPVTHTYIASNLDYRAFSNIFASAIVSTGKDLVCTSFYSDALVITAWGMKRRFAGVSSDQLERDSAINIWVISVINLATSGTIKDCYSGIVILRVF